jgi:hypothetical protein
MNKQRSLLNRLGVSSRRDARTPHAVDEYPCRCEVCLATTSYRLVRWVESQGCGHSLAARRAIVAMSVGWIPHAWLAREAGLSAKEADTLLQALKAQGALETLHEPSLAVANQPAPPASSSLLHRLQRWWLSPMPPPDWPAPCPPRVPGVGRQCTHSDH